MPNASNFRSLRKKIESSSGTICLSDRRGSLKIGFQIMPNIKDWRFETQGSVRPIHVHPNSLNRIILNNC